MKASKRKHTVSVRIDPELKEKAEKVLKEVGMSTSKAITLFYKEIVLCNGIPFRVGLPYKMPIFEDQLTKEELLKEIKKGLKEKGIPAKDAIESIKKEFDL